MQRPRASGWRVAALARKGTLSWCGSPASQPGAVWGSPQMVRRKRHGSWAPVPLHSLLVPSSDLHHLRSEATGGGHLAPGGTSWWPLEEAMGSAGGAEGRGTRQGERTGVGLTSRKPGHRGASGPTPPSHSGARGLLLSRHQCLCDW